MEDILGYVFMFIFLVSVMGLLTYMVTKSFKREETESDSVKQLADRIEVLESIICKEHDVI